MRLTIMNKFTGLLETVSNDSTNTITGLNHGTWLRWLECAIRLSGFHYPGPLE